MNLVHLSVTVGLNRVLFKKGLIELIILIHVIIISILIFQGEAQGGVDHIAPAELTKLKLTELSHRGAGLCLRHVF